MCNLRRVSGEFSNLAEEFLSLDTGVLDGLEFRYFIISDFMLHPDVGGRLSNHEDSQNIYLF